MNTAAPPLPPPANPRLRRMANALRALAMDAVEKANSGHPGMPMGMADAATVLFTQFLKFDPLAPDWPDRDRFVLSAGHGSMLLYGLLHLLGYPDMTLDELKHFRQLGSRTAGHPERGLAPGIETTTGPLGQGLANSVGMALAERHLAAEFGDDLVNHYTYAICGDGCLMEGISHEAISLAGHLQAQQADRAVGRQLDHDRRRAPSLSVSDDQLERFRAHGWEAERVDGLNHDEVAAAIRRAQTHDRPSLIACKTMIAFGAPTKAGTAAAHGSPLGAEEIKGAQGAAAAGNTAPFVVPDDLYAEWRQAGVARRRRCGRNGNSASRRRPPTGAAEFERRFKGDLPQEFDAAIAKVCDEFRAKNAKIATRQASGEVLDALVPAVPETHRRLGRSDRRRTTPRPRTRPRSNPAISPAATSISACANMGMAAAMNGIAAHGGLIPYGGTFLTFTDYARPAIRLSALMEVARHLCDDARFDRSRRGRPDASAGRASRGAARDPASAWCSARPTRSRPPNAGRWR